MFSLAAVIYSIS